MSNTSIDGFSKLSKEDKIQWITQSFLEDPEAAREELLSFWHCNDAQQKIFEGFSENTVSNYFLPFGIAPNFLIDGRVYAVPMVIEESSVVAAASAAAKYWKDRGGFKTTILGTEKIGQIHFLWNGEKQFLDDRLDSISDYLQKEAEALTRNMIKRGGGILGMEFISFEKEMKNLFQLQVKFNTCDSMGANFINSVLESFAQNFEFYLADCPELPADQRKAEIIMSILSNNTPNCRVKAEVSCPISELGNYGNGMSSRELAVRFHTAVKIAKIDPFRATTHNKGIYNGVDAVVIATGNDFRAIEAAGHSYAARDGQYRSLSDCSIEDDLFTFGLEIPLALGTVGGLTSLHPLSKRSLEILGKPSAEQLMSIIASVGLAQNFAAVRSLVTTGIQKGHMKMHLRNILNHLKASQHEIEKCFAYFEDKVVSYSDVREYLTGLRTKTEVNL
jgi:hydroxymethylglutaryl-CoA reductase